MKLKIIPGNYNVYNHFSSDIGWQGLLACGNNNYVQVIDPSSGLLIQTLERHQNHVNLVKWAPCSFYHDLKKPYTLKLASADISGVIVIWECSFSTVLCEFNRNGKRVQDMKWMKNQEVAIDFLLVLQASGQFGLWNTDSGNIVWVINLSEPLFEFTLDSHDPSNAAFRGEDFLILLSGISLLKPPDNTGRKFYICNSNNTGNNGSTTGGSETPSGNTIGRSVVSRSAKIIKATTRRVMEFGANNSSEIFRDSDSNMPGSSSTCIQILYHAFCQNHIVLVYPREILIMDLMIFQAVSCITLDKNSPNFVKVYSCWQNDVLYCLHENGIVTVRGRRPVLVLDDGEEVLNSPKYRRLKNGAETSDLHMIKCNASSWVEAGPYQTLCQTEPAISPSSLRLLQLRNTRMGVCMSVCPRSELRLVVVAGDTRVQVWEMQVQETIVEIFPETDSFVISPNNLVRIPNRDSQHSKSPSVCLYEMTLPMVDYREFMAYFKENRVLGSFRIVPNNYLRKKFKKFGRIEKWGKLSMKLSALHQGLLTDPTAIATNPLNLNQCDWPVVAVGNSKGCLQIWNLQSYELEREYQPLHCPINGIQWLSEGHCNYGNGDINGGSCCQGQLLVYGRSCGGGGIDWTVPFSHSDDGSSGNNDIHASPSAGTGAMVGQTSGSSNAPLKVKNSMCLLNLTNGHVTELRPDTNESPIDLVRISQLRQYISVLLRDGTIEIWDAYRVRKIRDINPGFKPVTLMEWSNVRNANLAVSNHSESLSADREKFLTIDAGGFMQHIVIEGGLISKGRRVPVEMSLGRVTAMAYWNNVVILGDFEGNLLFWNFKSSKSLSGILGTSGRILRIKLANNRPPLHVTKQVSVTGDVQNHQKSSSSKLVFVLAVDSVSVWNWNEGSMLKMIKWTNSARDNYLLSPTIQRIHDCDWADDGQSLVLLSPLELSIVRANNLEKSSSPISLLDFNTALPRPCNVRMLPPKISALFKCHMQQYADRGLFSFKDVNSTLYPDLEGVLEDKQFMYVLDWLSHNWRMEFPDSVPASYRLVQRYLYIASLFGDEYECRFWLAVWLSYFQEEPTSGAGSWIYESLVAIPPGQVYRATQLARLYSLERKRCVGSLKQTQKCADAFIMLGELDKAVRLLLETPPTQTSYVADMQLACLLSNQSAVRSSSQNALDPDAADNATTTANSQQHYSTVKLVATQFIANNCLKEGVQLLCAIGKQQDACRYLETYGEWKTALWLARCTLSTKEVRETENRWVTAVLNAPSSSKTGVILQLVNLREADRIMSLLLSLHQSQLAVRFLEFCQLRQQEAQLSKEEDDGSQFFITPENIQTSVRQFCKILTSIGCKQMCSDFMHKYIPADTDTTVTTS